MARFSIATKTSSGERVNTLKLFDQTPPRQPPPRILSKTQHGLRFLLFRPNFRYILCQLPDHRQPHPQCLDLNHHQTGDGSVLGCFALR